MVSADRFVYIIKRKSHGSLKILILFSTEIVLQTIFYSPMTALIRKILPLPRVRQKQCPLARQTSGFGQWTSRLSILIVLWTSKSSENNCIQ